ncbi:(d)CMP kinase [Sulfuracidifex tepidarius]|uniref:Cytidylate kinase n=1 Tax=Sulfuracidifex tepidarius TaxID=1294262 RepID=A0A510E3P5_9CREN|nr:AAA family ATPase [Sulfuracidifex tepidarius]BBG27134.1 Cytidylate kinase [Sulfuracidifex tepidarius]
MIITISGPPGSGKTSVARLVAQHLSADLISAGSFFRKIASDIGISVVELNRKAESDFSIDSKLDSEILRMVLEARDENRNVIVESHIAGWLLREYSTFSIYLNAPVQERARRISIRDKISFNEALLEIFRREFSHYTRFMHYYGIDITDISLFDLSINTKSMKPEEIASLIENFISLSLKTA